MLRNPSPLRVTAVTAYPKSMSHNEIVLSEARLEEYRISPK